VAAISCWARERHDTEWHRRIKPAAHSQRRKRIKSSSQLLRKWLDVGTRRSRSPQQIVADRHHFGPEQAKRCLWYTMRLLSSQLSTSMYLPFRKFMGRLAHRYEDFHQPPTSPRQHIVSAKVFGLPSVGIRDLGQQTRSTRNFWQYRQHFQATKAEETVPPSVMENGPASKQQVANMLR
jgi:hypothetical protein